MGGGRCLHKCCTIVSKQKNSYFQHEDKEKFKKIKKDLIQMRNFIEKNFEFVGDKFSQEIKNIYYDKGKNKNIYGTTTSLSLIHI